MRRKIWYVLALLMVAVSAAADSLTNLTEITDPDDADLMYVVDVSQTTGSKLRSKKCTISSLKTEFGGLADADYTDFTCASDSCTLDADVVGTAEIADADFGDWTCSSGSCSLDGDVIDETNLADDSIDSEHYNDASIDAAHLAADVIDESKLADDSIDSEHYNDASIDAAHLAADVIDESKLADDSIDSEHYNDASIDPAHLNISNAETDEYVLSYEGDTSNFQWIELTSGGDIQAVGECTTGECTADFINGTDIVDDAVDSEHINDGAIDEPHLNAANSPTDEYVLSYEGDTSNFQWVEMTGGGLSANSVLESHLKAVDSASDEECLTYETTTGDFEWQSCGTGTAESLDEIDDPGDDTSLTVGDYEVEWWSNHDQGTRQYVHVMYDTDTSKTYATTLLRIGNADVDDPNVTFLETGTGNPQTAWTGNFSVGPGGAVWSDSSIEGASVIYTGANASPDEAGELVWDNTITGLDQGALKWYDGDETRELIDLDYSVGVRESGDDGLFVRYNWNGGAGYYDLAAASGSSTTFYAEDGDGTEVAITNAKEWKFVEGAGIDIDWTDTSDGSDADPYDLTVTVATTQVINAINPSAAMTIGDGGDTLAINTSDWDIGTDGTITGAGGAISMWTNDSGYTTTTDQVGTLTTGDLCVNNGTTVECTVNTEAELETALDGTNLLTATEGAAAYEAIDSAITKTDEAETITADWVNTANPWADNEVADTITASNYLPLAGGTLTGEVVVDNLGLEFTAGDDHSNCSAFSATGGGIFFDDSEGKFKKCQDNNLTDLDTTGGTPSFDTITGGTNTTAAMVVGTGGSMGVTGSGTITATDLSCTDCIAATEIEDVYALHAGDAYTGTHDFGGADDLEVPNGTNPTTDTAGQVAIDTNATAYGALEMYGATGSALLPAVRTAQATIWDVATLQGDEDAIPLMRVESTWAPYGITVVDIYLAGDASNSESYTLEEWTNPTTASSDIETVAFSAATEAEDDGTLSDSAVAAGSYVFIDLPTSSALNFLQVTFTFIINQGS